MTRKPKKPTDPFGNLVFKPFTIYPLYTKDQPQPRHPSIFKKMEVISATPSRHKPDTKK
jgi:hypothetical protein